MPSEPKQIMRRYFDRAHDAVLWKVDGLSEYALRRPLTPTGTTLLGLVKHLAWVELGYFGDVFGRPSGIELPGAESEDPNVDMYAAADESKEYVLELFAQARSHALETIDALALDAEGHVAWWGENNPVTLRLIIVHVTTEIHRHLGQMDILREQIDGSAGLSDGNTNMAGDDEAFWLSYVEQLNEIASTFDRS